jgi:hypothetical protein
MPANVNFVNNFLCGLYIYHCKCVVFEYMNNYESQENNALYILYFITPYTQKVDF